MSYVQPWYCLKTKPRMESSASQHLESLGIETFLPTVRTRKPTHFVHALFPTYLFSRLSPEIIWDAKRLYGVSYIVSFASEPAEVPDSIIETIRSGMEEGYARPDSLKIGDEVTVTSGPFAELRGVFQREISGTERVIILLNALHQARYEVSRFDLRKN